MRMTTYAVYSPETGEVVHFHHEPVELRTSPQEIIRMTDPRGERKLEVLEVDEETPLGTALRVENGQLQTGESESDIATAAGAVAASYEESLGERTYEQRRR